jgi:hypothetical protein
MRRNPRFVLASLAVTLSACGHPAQSNVPDTRPVASHTATTGPEASAPSAPPSRQAPPPDDDADPASSPPPLSSTSARQAKEQATAFLRAFGRTDRGQEGWWQGVRGFLTPAAAQAYAPTAVAQVPVHTVNEGSARLRPGSTTYHAEVDVTTNAGVWTVTLVRAQDRWLVERARAAS